MLTLAAISERERMSKHIPTVQAIYEAFGRKDIPAILSRISDDISWDYAPVSTDVPWLQARRGKDGVVAFFQALGTECEHTHFAVKALLGNERLVVALIDLDLTVRRTGRTIREVDEAHVWHFDDRGQVISMRHCADTHAHQLAWTK